MSLGRRNKEGGGEIEVLGESLCSGFSSWGIRS
jgi:hypothetical protein